MLKRMSELSGQRKKLIVVGCMASVQPDDIVRSAPTGADHGSPGLPASSTPWSRKTLGAETALWSSRPRLPLSSPSPRGASATARTVSPSWPGGL